MRFTHPLWRGALTVEPAPKERLRITREGETRDGEPYAYGIDLELADIIRLRDHLTALIEPAIWEVTYSQGGTEPRTLTYASELAAIGAADELARNYGATSNWTITARKANL